MQLEVVVSTEVDAAPERAFDFAAANEVFPRILRAYGPIPGIASIEMLDGARLAAGSRRRVLMTDGTEILEELLAYDRPQRHRYRWLNAPKPPFSLLVSRGEGDWIFRAAGSGTRIEWTYTFDLTSPLVALPAKLVLAIFKRWMQRGLDEVARLLRDERVRASGT